MADSEAGPQAQDDVTVLRTDDLICLSSTSTAASRDGSTNGDRVSLAAEGFGNRMCYLQGMTNKELPFDISVAVFVLEQALSVRALQEMVSSKSQETTGQSGHRTLLYGHAVLLRHSHSNMYLSCLSTQSSSSDKLAFDVGLTEQPEGESCWWTIHPASKQRSEGEKVRVGDDLILVSVASERYLHIGAGALVIASFQQTLWTVQPVSSGAVRQKSLGFVFGGDVLRLFHGDECLTIPPRDAEQSTNANKDKLSTVMYETGSVSSHARSLWKLEHVRIKWAEGFMGWGQPCRLRHITSGRYLAVTEDNQVVTFHRAVATEDATGFLLRQSKDDRKFQEGREDEGMGNADIKYGDSLVYVQHMKTGLWLSYQTFETKKRGVGRVEEKKAVVMVEGHMDDGLNISRAQMEEDKSARVIRKCTSLISRFVKALENLKTEGRSSRLWEAISLAEVIKTLEDLIDYFAPPDPDLGFEEKQVRRKALKNRQDLFQEEGMIALILETIDRCSQWKSMRHLAHLIGEDSASKWNDMINYLYLLLAAMIQGNRANCCQFADSSRLDWLVNRLESQQSSQGVLDVLHCVLVDSPEALNVIKEQHIRTIISLIDKHGRDPKVLDVLCSLCVGNEVAVRSNQHLICENLLPGRDLLLQTKIVDYVYSMHPNIYVGRREGSAMYLKWYYEAIIDHIEHVGATEPLIRVGYANTEGFVPYPGGGEHWGCNGLGDDLYSYGFDGVNLWTAGKPKRVRTTQQTFQKGDVIGCLLDLSIPQMTYTVNGVSVKGLFRDFNLDGMFFPAISISSKVSIRFMLGGEHGKLKYGPPNHHSPVYESLLPKEKLRIQPCFQLANIPKGLLVGPAEVVDYVAFVPQPVEIGHVQLPGYIENIKEKLAENIHELWAMGKVEQGWQYDERRDDYYKVHPCLINFERLPGSERKYNLAMAHDTLRTLLAMGYHITYDAQYTSNNRLKTIKLSNNYLQSNGYKPAPIDLSNIVLNEKMKDLVELLAENTHNVWSKERIKQGWTYGLNEDSYNRRSPHLVPYSKVDEAIKKANRETASETVRTLMVYGYNLEPPTNEAGESGIARDLFEKKEEIRIYRAEKTYAQTEGKWYYEVEVITTGNMKIGWCMASVEPGTDLGGDGKSYMFNGKTVRKYYQGSEAFGKAWKKGDVIGCMLDLNDKTICFSLNGELMMDRLGQEIAFKNIDVSDAYVPAFCLTPGQQTKVNYGQDVNTLKFFTTCGLQEGYEPFCVNMTKPMPLWYTKEQPIFGPLEKNHPRLEVIKVPGGSSSPPCLKVHSKTYGSLERVCLEFLRLSLPVRCHRQFVPPGNKPGLTALERKMNAANFQDDALHHGFRDDHSVGGKTKRGLFKKKGAQARSMDDSNVDLSGKSLRPQRMKRGSSDTNLAAEFLNVPDKEKSGSKYSLIDKFADVSKAISDKHTNQKKGKSPFSLFKKSRSREPSPLGDQRTPLGSKTLPHKFQVSSSEYSEESETDSMMLGPELSLIRDKQHGKKQQGDAASKASYGSEAFESETEVQELEAKMDMIDEFYYGVRIFPGQDPNQVYVGWVTPAYHMHAEHFDMKKIRHVVVCSLDVDYRVKSSASRKNCYVVSAGDLQHRYGHQEESGKRMTPGLLIGSHVDVSTGVLSFTVNGKEVANKFQVEPGTMLFPAVFCEPTNKEVLQFELGRCHQPLALPLSAVLFRSGKHVQPQSPPRLDLQIISQCQWSRVPVTSSAVHSLKLSDIRGWSMLSETPVSMMALHIPEEDRCLDALELIEHPDLLKFHGQTLDLYQAVCALGNHKVAHELTNHVSEIQMIYVIKSKYMPGPLRMGFHDLMIAIHLEHHQRAMTSTQNEFIVPLTFEPGEFSLYREGSEADPTAKIKETVPILADSVSIRPTTLLDSEKLRSEGHYMKTCPPFPLEFLKREMMYLLKEAVENGAAHMRDPIGGSNANFFVPLVRVVDRLMVIGLLDDRDLHDLLCLIDPLCFDAEYNRELEAVNPQGTIWERLSEATNKKHGLIQMKLSEPVKLELCQLLHHLCDCQIRHRIESIVSFAYGFVGLCQSDQYNRYQEIKQADLPPAQTARRTREFRCPPQEQMRALLAFRRTDLECEDPSKIPCPCSDLLMNQLKEFHSDLLRHSGHPGPIEEAEDEANKEEEVKEVSWTHRLLALISSKEEKTEDTGPLDPRADSLNRLIINTVINWAKADFIQDQQLVREMFSLLHRQYDGVEELVRCLDQAYVISQRSIGDIKELLRALGNVRALLKVQVDAAEEEILKTSIWDLADNKVFFQHPDLIRALGIHETVMQLMINTLNKAQSQPNTTTTTEQPKRRGSISSTSPEETENKDPAADMVVSCCRFLCYFCRTGRQNQSAMFDHLSYLLENSCMLLSRPSLRGSCPLDVAYSSLMDNNELALALKESDLDKVAVYLSRCGQQSNQDLTAMGYPDIGWDPVEGERFLDFYRFCVWVNGDSVEENANLVVRLLIRRPECLGPALRGEGGGLLKAMKDGILMSEQVAAARDKDAMRFLLAVTEEEDDDRGNYLHQTKYDFTRLPPEDDEDYIDMGGAILNFYGSLVDLLGRCAPDAETIKAGRSDSLRARAILRSLVSIEDLEGVLGLRFILPVGKSDRVMGEDGEYEKAESGPMPPGLLPPHKSAVVMFMERVYGVPDQQSLFHLLEDGFLPDLRAATTLDASAPESDMALALNRYICNEVLPLLSNYCHFFQDADHASSILDATLHTVYRLSKCKSLTKNQRDTVSDFLVSYTSELRPPMMTSLLRKLVIDVPALTENSVVALRLLTNHYERCGRYYGSGGWGSHGSANEEEKRLTMMLFNGIFDSLAQRAYDPELFSKALPCLSAIACALSPDYSLSHQEDWRAAGDSDAPYVPQPAEISRVKLTDQLVSIARDFAEHFHDAWALVKVDNNWTYGTMYDEDRKLHPNLKPFKNLPDKEQKKYFHPVTEELKAMVAWGWSVELDSARAVSKAQIKRKMSKMSLTDYAPRPMDLRNVTLTREMLNMADRLAENTHDAWAKRKKEELEMIGGGIHPQLVPYDVLTEREKKRDRDRAQELLRFLQMHGFRVHTNNQETGRKRDAASRQSKDSEADSGVGVSSMERRFAYRLLEKLLEYVDKAAWNMKNMKPATRYSRRHSYSISSEDVKFFGKVVLPLVERYFRAHKEYFITDPNVPLSAGTASIKEKEMTASLFSKLALLLRQRITAFGHDVQISVRCLQTLVQAIDAKAVVRHSPEIVRSSLLPFLTYAADDLTQTVQNLRVGRFSHVKGTITRGATSLNYVHMVLLPVLSSMFDHLGRYGFGSDLLVGEQQLCCYRILNALYALGTSSSTFVERDSVMGELDRHRPALGECVASFASTFPVAFLEPQLNIFNKNSILYDIPEDRIAAHSLEAKEVMDQVAETVPALERIVAEIGELAESGGKYNEAPHVIEVTLPMLCSYLPFWWSKGPDNVTNVPEGKNVTTVTADLMNSVLGNVLKLIRNNIGTPEAPWMTRIATRTQPIIVNATAEMLKDHILPVAEKLKDNAKTIAIEEDEYHHERRYRSASSEGDEESVVHQHFQILVRDMYAFYPLLIKYVDLHRSFWLKNPLPEPEQLYLCVADVFNIWSKSHMLKKEEQNFVSANEIDNMALIMPSQDKHTTPTSPVEQRSERPQKGKRRPAKARMESTNSLNVACLKRLLPIGLNMFGGQEQELVQQAKSRLIQKQIDGDIEDFLKTSFQTEEKPEGDDAYQWQKTLYKKIGSKQENKEQSLEKSIERVLAMAKVLQGLHWVEHPPASMKMAWKKVVSTQRKRAVMACFRMIPLHAIARHRAINLFLKSYKRKWLEYEEPGHQTLIEDITGTAGEEEEVVSEEAEEVDEGPQPLSQLITAFSRAATTELSHVLEADFLYISYANIMSQSCHGDDEEDEGDGGGEDTAATIQEQEMEKQQLLSEQNRLADRGAAEMVLMYISASKGQWSDMVIGTIELGISILRGGNVDVQKKMITHLREKKDVGFFTSVAGLMQQCSVLDLDAFERCNKAIGLGVSEADTSSKNLENAELTVKLFRFLQLLCEGHNLEFQNYLRTQAGNTTTVNVVICTVDYLLRIQESIMDFYWHYSGKDIIDPAGKESFCRAITVAAQVFSAITEYIQGPCAGNQLALAHSRLWDAVGGFLYIFAHMQDKLSKDPDQLELLREFMTLQKEMMIMLLSMLEGNVVNGPIGKQMVDTLVESSQNFEMILKFFDIFLKMKDLTTSDAFMEFDVNKDGLISHKEFRRAMEMQKVYTSEEIEYVMMCVDANQDGYVDFEEFTDRFHDPAKDIGFNVAVLLTNLSEHMPNDPRLERFLEKASSVLEYFEPFLGRIEIMGNAGRIERVYFEIKQSNIDQWEKPQIKESKRAFLHGVVNEEGDKEKLEAFTNFCEDTIFEMQHATSISPEEQTFSLSQLFSRGAPAQESTTSGGSWEMIKSGFSFVKDLFMMLFWCLSPSNIRAKYQLLRSLTFKELIVGLFKLNFNIAFSIITFLFTVVLTFGRFILAMMMGDKTTAEEMRRRGSIIDPPPVPHGRRPSTLEGLTIPGKDEKKSKMEAFGLDILKEEGEGGQVQFKVKPHKLSTQSSSEMSEGEFTPDGELAGEETANGTAGGETLPDIEVQSEIQDQSMQNGPVPQQPTVQEATAPVFEESLEDIDPEAALAKEPPIEVKQKTVDLGNFLLSLLARNFYNFKLIALALAFAINFILLFFKVSVVTEELLSGGDDNGAGDEDMGEDDGEMGLDESVNYLNPLLRSMAVLHSLIAFASLVAYYVLKVPLVLFKREKEICRSLEFDGMWISEQPSEDDIKGHWDKLVISTKSFPDKYWDPFVKKKVLGKYSEQYEPEQINALLGITKEVKDQQPATSLLPSFFTNLDWQYQTWKWGIIFTDNSFLYISWYFTMSVLGNFNYFFFAAHLLDVAICFKTLGTILQSVTHNGKQLMLTVLLLSIIVYVYTVIAFNFFRKFYNKGEDGEDDYKCHDMLTCYVFHLYVGVRAGGGIGDEIDAPDGDPYEVYRILFDITFFFFVIIILLAIIQGLIIDAFGELRDQLEQVKEDLESSCFICGIGKDYFDKVPHGFETHVKNEHNFANYMFFLMHLINKPDTEYTGQETYVWELYQERSWDFFPVGDCFRKQYEEELGS